MKPNHALKYCLLLALCMQGFFALAQKGFGYKAALDSVQQSGFYSIALTPAMVAKCLPTLEDIRIKDNSNAEAPYIIKYTSPVLNATQIQDLPIIKTSNTKNTIVENTTAGGISELLLFIKNTDAYRTVTLSGGDDTSHWFVIKENIVLSNATADNNKAIFIQSLVFPYSNYKYFQVSILGKDVLPVNVTKAGIYKYTSNANDAYDALPNPQTLIKDSSDKRTYIWLKFDGNYKIDKLQFSFQGVQFYNRSYTLYNNANSSEIVASGNATSKQPINNIKLSQVKTNRLLLVINNQDNAPLQLENIRFYQLPISLIAYLNAGKSYSLFFADSAAVVPHYDLQYFTDSINANTKVLHAGTIEKITLSLPLTEADNSTIRKWMLWLVIALVLAFLLFFSYKMIKDIGNKTNNNASV